MQNFDYIELADFRSALQSDYAEMQNCAETQAWKSAQVLAGSIVECLLVDYLASQYKEKKEGKDPLKMDLGEAISACKASGALTERTADLCAVVRSYRNLIHPGRMVRLGEKSPNKASCSIAVSLIDMIVDDIARTRRGVVGLTGEQILSKIRRDDQVRPILKHLLEDVREQQRLRLVTELIPGAYGVLFSDEAEADRLSASYRIVFNSLPDALKTEAVDRFAIMLREQDGDTIATYRSAFFSGFDIEYLSPQYLPIVKEHLLNCMRPTISFGNIRAITGLGKFLSVGEAVKWVGPIVNTILSSAAPDRLKERVRDMAISSTAGTSTEFDAAVYTRLDGWISKYEAEGNLRNVQILRSLRDDFSIPF